MNGFTDIHTHILPGVDDGAQDLSQALSLLRMAWEDGTKTVILTPHYRDQYKKTTDELKESYHLLQEKVKEALPDMKVYLGSEVAYETDALEAMHAREVLTLNGSRYVLLDFWPWALRSQIISGVSETVRCGFVPIVAHVERYMVSRSDSTLIEELGKMGALLQMNADSILGRNGFWIKRFCHKLLKNRTAHFIASDAHDTKRRPPLLQKCYLRIHKKYGQEYAYELFYENAQAVIEDRPICQGGKYAKRRKGN